MSNHAVFAMLVFEIHLPAARSLKEKRKTVKSLVERLHKRFRVSVAETDHHDLHQRAEIGVAVVEGSPARLEMLLQELRRTVDLYQEASVLRWDVEYAEVGL